MTTGDLAAAISSVAIKAYRAHKGDEQFSVLEQKKIYADLLKTVAEDFYDGDITTHLKSMRIDRKANESEDGRYSEELLLSAFERLEPTLKAIKAVDQKASKSIKSHRFQEQANKIYQDVFDQYIKDNPIEEAQTPNLASTTFGGEAEPVPVTTENEPAISGSALIKQLVGSMNAQYLTDIDNHLAHVVATSWVDGRVVDGKAKGFTNLDDVVTRVEAQLHSRIYNYLASRSDGTFSKIENGVATKYIVFAPNRRPVGVPEAAKLPGTEVEQSYHESFSKLVTEDGKRQDVKILIAPDFGSAQNAIAAGGKLISDVKENKSDATDFTRFSFTNADKLAENELPVFYSHILTTGNNYKTFLGYKFKPLADTYKDAYRTRYEEGAVAAEEQGSKALKIHQQSTPRLTLGPNGRLVVDHANPFGAYLTSEDFALVAVDLPKVGSDLPTIRKAINDLITTNESHSAHLGDIYRSIYHRFFAEEDYAVDGFKNPSTGAIEDGVMMRSYSGIVAADKVAPMSVEEYSKMKDRSLVKASPNAALDDSLSSIITSMRSTVVNEQFNVRAGTGQKTNIAGHGATVDGFNTNFIEATTNKTELGAVTQNRFLGNDRIVVEKISEDNKVPRLRFTIKADNGKSELIYEANLNWSEADDHTKSFTMGIPLTIVNKNKDYSRDALAKLFSGFGFPNNITNPLNLETVYNSIENSGLQNKNNLAQIVPKGKKAMDVTVDNLYLNMLFTMILNGDRKLPVVKSLYSAVGANIPEPVKGSVIKYSPTSVLYGYRNAISDIMLRTEGELARKRQSTFEGDRISTYTVNSHMKRTAELADAVTEKSIHFGNVLTPANRQYKIGKQTFVKGQLKVGDEIKSLADLTEKENSIMLMENAFLQQAKRSSGHNTVLLQIGAQSDRLHPQLTEFEAIGGEGGIFIKNNGLNKVSGWDSKEWKGDSTVLSGFGVPQADLAAVTSHDTLKAFLKAHTIKYNDLKQNTNLTKYGRILEDNKGNAYVPESALKNETGLDVHALARKTLDVHQTYYKNLDRVVSGLWGTAIEGITGETKKFTNLQAVSNWLKANPTLYSDVKAESSLINMATIGSREGVDAEGKTVSYATVPEDVLQSIAVFSNDMLGLDYIEMMRKMFRRQLATIGYKQLSPRSVGDIGKIMHNDKISEDTAKKVLFDAYFYNANILGVSALNLHTGGIEQFDVKAKGAPMFNVADSFKDGNLNHEAIVDNAKKIKVPGSKETLGTISLEELQSLRGQGTSEDVNKMERLAHMKVVLENNTAFPDIESKAKAFIFNDLTKHMGDKFVSQVKRNAMLGSSLQLPRLVGDNEPGFFLGKSSKNMTVVDDEPVLKVLGMSGGKKTTATDGVQEVHELHTIMLNNSMGNDESSFKYNGVAIKDLTVANDENGFMEGQKKASFGLSSNDILKKGSLSGENKLFKMNTAVEFASKDILVDTKGAPEWHAITPGLWKTHGLSYGWMRHTLPDGTFEMVHSTQVLNKLKTGGKATQDFEAELNDPTGSKYMSAKVMKHFNNMQDLWEYHGASMNDNAWKTIANIIGYHSGVKTQNMDLSDAAYPLRHAFIEKMGYVSQAKTGSKNTITWENLLDPSYAMTRFDADGNPHKRYSEVSNLHHGTILNAEHPYDTSASVSKATSTDRRDLEDAEVSLITQIVSATSAEGVSKTESENINNTIGTLSRASLDGLRNEIVNKIISDSPELINEKQFLLDKLKKGNIGTSEPELKLLEGIKEHARKLITDNLSNKADDPGLATELLSMLYKDSLTFDQKQLLPLVQTQIFSDFNKKSVRMKFAGNQFVVTPSHEFIPTYNLKLGGKELMSGLNREDMNIRFYGEAFKKLTAVQRTAIDETYPLKNITDPSKIMLSDNIWNPATGELARYIDVKNNFREQYQGKPEDFGMSLAQVLSNYQSRFADGIKVNEQKLNWANWERYDRTDGTKHGIMESDEFRAYDAIDSIAKKWRAGKTFDQAFEIDLTKSQVATKKKPHPRFLKTPDVEVVAADIKSKVPIGLIREYYFDKVVPVVPGGAEMIGDVKEKAFLTWLSGEDGADMAKKVYNYVGENATKDPEFKKKFKAHLYNLLQNEEMGWVPTRSEMYMPHMHWGTYLINTGDNGKPADSLTDIIGLNEMPSTNKLESMKILSHEEAVAHSFSFDDAFGKFKGDGGKYHTLKPGEQNMYNDYVRSVENMRTSTTKFFNDRVRERFPSGFKAKSMELFEFQNRNIDTMLTDATRKRNNSAVGTSAYEAMGRLIDRLELAKTQRNLNQRHESGTTIFDAEYNDFVKRKVSTLSNNFLKTLEFITARIPAQGKQSFTAGRIKNFIFSSKNSVYGPLEFVLIAGLDYDIDKQNMMTWSVDGDGQVVRWEKYMDEDGKLSIDKLNTKIASDEQTVRANFSKVIADKEAALKILTDKQDADGAPINGEEATKLASDIVSLQEIIENTKKSMEKQVVSSEKINRAMFAKAGENYVVHNLIETISNPKNAIEASTPISIDKPTAAATVPDITKLFGDGVGVEDLLTSQQITSNVNPFSTIQYEKINMAGKSSIGIFASDLKSYLASFYATRTATAEEMPYVALKTDIKGLPDTFTTLRGARTAESFGIDKSGLQFFKAKESNIQWNKDTAYPKDATVKSGKFVYTALVDAPKGTELTDRAIWELTPDVVTNKVLANAGRWTGDGAIKSEKAKDAMKLLQDAHGDDARQSQIISDYIDDVKSFNKMNVESQAWEDLSQLLTAATDNAKELILGKIGANNTTNSLISTMVRMGVDLKDALNLINAKEIKDFVKAIDEEGDLYNKLENTKAAAILGEVLDAQYADRIIDKLKSALPTVPGSAASDEVIYSYLTSPVRQLYTYAKAALEFSSLAKKLSINQGLRNSAFEVHSYITSINSGMNKAIATYNKDNPNDPIDLKYSVEDFVNNVTEGKTEEVNKVLQAFDKIKTGINVPFVFMKNAHYFGYFEAMFQAKQIRDSLSYINKKTESIIDTAKELYGDRTIKKPTFAKLSDTLYDFGVLEYLGEVAGRKNPLILRGNKYDLSLSKGDGEYRGRLEFLMDVRDAVDTIKGNPFVDSLKFDRSKVDRLTGIALKIIKGPDLNQVPSGVFAKLQAGLEQIKASEPDLHNALFLYSLISNKGGYGGGSFVGLFNIKDYIRFSDFLKKNSDMIFHNVDTNSRLIISQNPLLLPQRKTTKVGSKEDNIEYNEQYDAEMEEPFNEYDDPGANDRSYNRPLTKHTFITDHLNAAKRNPDAVEPPPDMFRSSSNDLVYQWNKTLKLYVPQTTEVPKEAIQMTIPKTAAEPLKKNSGFVDGFVANMPGINWVKDETGVLVPRHEKGTVIAFITPTMKADALSEKTTAPRALLNLLRSDAERVFKGQSNMYIIEYGGRNQRFGIASREELLNANPGYEFDEGHIKIGSKEFDNVESKSVPSWKLFEKDGTYRTEDFPGAQPVDKELETTANAITKSVYDKAIVDKMVSKASGNIDKSYNEVKVDKEYTNYTDQLLESLIVSTIPNTTLEDAKRIRTTITRQSENTQDIVSNLNSAIDYELGANPTTLDKLNVLAKGPEGLKDLYDSLKVNDVDMVSSNMVDYPKKDKVPQAAINLVNSASAENNITQMTISEFKGLNKMLGGLKEDFDDYIRLVFLPETKVDALILDNDAYLAKGEKISATKQLTNLNIKVEKSKNIAIPKSMKYDYVKPASKDMLVALASHLNSRLPGVKWLVLSPEAIKQRFGEKFITDKGFFKTNGTVVINSENATLETPLHEFGHIYSQYLRVEDAPEYQRVMTLAQEHPLFESVKKSYPELSNSDVAEEVFSELLSMSATEKMLESADITKQILSSASDTTGPFGRLIKAIKSIFHGIFGAKAPIDLDITDSLGSVINRLSDDIVFGKESMLSNFSQETKDAIMKSRNSATFTVKEAREALMARGYIEWYCV
jgi:hypothetical protein